MRVVVGLCARAASSKCIKWGGFAFASLLLSGCAPLLMEDPTERLRIEALYDVQTQSRTVQEFLAAGATEQAAILKAQEVVAAGLKDPESARFRNVSIRKFQHGQVVCGEVNAKNSYGGYVGYVRFVAGVKSGTLEYRDRTYPRFADARNYGIDAGCN